MVAYDDEGAPSVVCVFAHSEFERTAALVLLESSPDSFVVSHGRRYSPDGQVEVYNPARPWYAGELDLTFEIEMGGAWPLPSCVCLHPLLR